MESEKDYSNTDMILDNGLFYSVVNNNLGMSQYVAVAKGLARLILNRMESLKKYKPVIFKKKDFVEMLNYFEDTEINRIYDDLPIASLIEAYQNIDIYGTKKKAICTFRGKPLWDDVTYLIETINNYISTSILSEKDMKKIIEYQYVTYHEYSVWSIVIDVLSWINSILKFYTFEMRDAL